MNPSHTVLDCRVLLFNKPHSPLGENCLFASKEIKREIFFPWKFLLKKKKKELFLELNVTVAEDRDTLF